MGTSTDDSYDDDAHDGGSRIFVLLWLHNTMPYNTFISENKKKIIKNENRY